jgi:hypothetical protein
MKIIANWVKAGHNKIYIKEQSFYSYAKLFGYQTKLSGRGGFKLLPSSVSTDCYNLELAGFGLSAISQFPGKSTIIAEVREGALCGVFFLGETKIYFKSRTLGPDADRFDLNWWQWAMGLQVPGAASTAVGGFSDLTLGQAAKYDLITLKNGDTVSGTVTVESVKIETSYGTLTFTIQELEKLTFEGSGNNVDIVSLRIGDKLSGSVQNNAIKVKLVGGNEIEIAKDKIRDIQLRKQDR